MHLKLLPFLFLSLCNAHDLIHVRNVHSSSIEIRLCYATEHNITHQKIYKSADCCYMHKGCARALLHVVQELEQYGYGIVIWDAYQPRNELEKIWRLLPDEKYITNPSKGDAHTCGMGLDVTLLDLMSRKEVEMPTPFDCITMKAQCDCCEVVESVRERRELLKAVMMKHGFVQKSQDPWWHFELDGWQDAEMPCISFDELP